MLRAKTLIAPTLHQGNVQAVDKGKAQGRLFAEVLLAEVLDLDPVLGGQPFPVHPQFFPERLRKARVITGPHLVCVQVRGHPLGETDIGQSSKDQDAVVAGKHFSDLIIMSFGQQPDACPESVASVAAS
jgi:hypothetical protein